MGGLMAIVPKWWREFEQRPPVIVHPRPVSQEDIEAGEWWGPDAGWLEAERAWRELESRPEQKDAEWDFFRGFDAG
jgi:hypothetical protein